MSNALNWLHLFVLLVNRSTSIYLIQRTQQRNKQPPCKRYLKVRKQINNGCDGAIFIPNVQHEIKTHIISVSHYLCRFLKVFFRARFSHQIDWVIIYNSIAYHLHKSELMFKVQREIQRAREKEKERAAEVKRMKSTTNDWEFSRFDL